MKADKEYYVKKRVKKGKDFVLKDVKVDLFDIRNKGGESVGEIFDRQNELNKDYERRLKRLEGFIKRLGDGLIENL